MMRNKITSLAFFILLLPSWIAAAQTEGEQPLLKFDDNYTDLPQVDTNASAPVVAQPLAIAKTAGASATQNIKGSMTVGVAAMQIDNPSAQFGKFSGLSNDTVYLIGAANIRADNEKRYWNFKIDDIALSNRTLNVNAGTLSKYKLHFGYGELDNLLSNNSQTPFYGAGGAVLTLPSGFVKSDDTSNMTTLAASMKNVDLGTKRKEGDASFSYETAQNVTLSFSFRRYLKNGVKSLGAVVLSDNDGPQGLVVPEPVHYHTDEFRTGLDWHGERGQANVEYYYSRFTNNDSSLTWDNPFNAPWYSDPYPDAGRTSLSPDNQHQRFSLSGSYKLATTTRLSAMIERGVMTQNEALLPYTINPASTITTPLPRSSLNARIDTSLFKLDLATQPLPALSLRAGFRHYDTDNRTPRDLYLMVINDSGNQVSTTSGAAEYNQPYDYKQNKITLDSAYYFGHSTTLKLGLDHDQKDYRYRAVSSTIENTYTAKLNKRWDAGATAFLDVAHGRKRTDGYDEKRVFDSVHTSDYLATLAAGTYFDNLPAMRQFDIADRDRRRAGIGVTLLPRADLTIGLHASHNQDEYNATQFGLQKQNAKNYTLDTTLAPDEFSSCALYYTRQHTDSQQASRAYWPGGLKATTSADPRNDWVVQQQDKMDTLGVNITLSFFEDQLPVQLSYAYSRINTDISFTADPASSINPPPSNMPALRGKRHTIDISGTYNVRDSLTVRVGAMLETYRANDWATDGYSPGSSAVPGVLLLSGSNASYRAFMLSTVLNYHF
ncbi:MAG: MtrB/PioB family decaheme-associated outer membrane protein [Gallionellaceae bacterium]|nr:MtrB/PioB family decaheme-associated outer membrane protein [Gallionellaceae bacterium]